MKLDDWLRKHHYKHTSRLSGPYETKPNDLHVIGTCGDCKYFSVEGGYCSHAKMSHFIPYGNFGCIHFEAKGEK